MQFTVYLLSCLVHENTLEYVRLSFFVHKMENRALVYIVIRLPVLLYVCLILDITVSYSLVPDLQEYETVLNEKFALPRINCDVTINTFGRDLLNMCEVYSLLIVNVQISSDN